MVKSTLNKEINYNELKEIDSENKAYFKEGSTATFDIKLYGNDIEITFGKEKYTFIEKGIVYFPIYLVINDIVSYQIGVYELFNSEVPNNLDEDGDIILNNLNHALFFTFIKKLIETNVSPKNVSPKNVSPKNVSQVNTDNIDEEIDKLLEQQGSPKDDTEDNDTEDNDTEDDDTDTIYNDLSPLDEQTVDETINESKLFKYKKSNPWIQNFMKNNNYNIIDTKYDGNCFFLAVSYGLKKIGINVTVTTMREILVGEITIDLFATYKENYINFSTNLKDIIKEQVD